MLKLINGDMLKEHEQIESGSVDLILMDPPYGTIKNAPTNWKAGAAESFGWDVIIEPAELFEIANRILRMNGKLILFSQEPYTSQLITNTIPNLPFNYRAVWEKDHFANALLVNKAMVGMYEDILIFSKKGGLIDSGLLNVHPLRTVFLEALKKSGKTRGFFIDLVGSTVSHYFTTGVQFAIPTLDNYNLMKDYIDFGHSHSELVEIDKEFKLNATKTHYDNNPSIFNIWEGNKYKSNVLKYGKDYGGYHPTQKPVLLLEDLIKTFSNEGDVVADLTMGSGSTGVACANTDRKFIGIELDPDYFAIAQERVGLNTVDDGDINDKDK